MCSTRMYKCLRGSGHERNSSDTIYPFLVPGCCREHGNFYQRAWKVAWDEALWMALLGG